MSTDLQLFDPYDGPRRRGRNRAALDREIRAAREEHTLSESLVTLARTLADQLDTMDRQCNRPDAKPYDRMPFDRLAQTYASVREQLFAVIQADPITRALAQLMADDDGAGAPARDLEGSPLPD